MNYFNGVMFVSTTTLIVMCILMFYNHNKIYQTSRQVDIKRISNIIQIFTILLLISSIVPLFTSKFITYLNIINPVISFVILGLNIYLNKTDSSKNSYPMLVQSIVTSFFALINTVTIFYKMKFKI